MSSATPLAAAQFAMSMRILSSALMGALFFIAIALYFVLPTDEVPPLWVPAAQLLAGFSVHLLLDAVGYRTLPLDSSLSDNDAKAQSRLRFQAATTMRFAFSEAIAIASIVLAFVLVEGGFLVYAVGMVVALVLMIVHVWPWSRPVGRFADNLEAAGKPSGLREAFGIPA